MSLYQAWQDAGSQFNDQAEYDSYWRKYFAKETENYKRLLAQKSTHIEGTIEDLARQNDMTALEYIGFLDGINSSLKTPIALDELTEQTAIQAEVDYEKLLFNMHAAKAEWLYSLKEWQDIFSEQKRKDIRKAYMTSKTVIKADKIGRNEPCPCGSGKKYKKCCAD